MRALSLAEALKIIEGTFAAAREHNCHALAAIILDAGGRIKAFQKQDGASLMRFEIAYGKAFAALSLGRSSRMVLQKAKEKPLFVQSLERIADGPLFLEAGGQLVRDGQGEIMGAIGVTGDINEMDARVNPVAKIMALPLRRECLDQLVSFAEAHIRRILSAYATYYNQAHALAIAKRCALASSRPTT